MESTPEFLGLKRREYLCYTSLLELGSSKVGAIVKKTGIPSSKIYEILDRLRDMGLVSYVRIGRIKHYQASDPKVLLSSLDEKRRKLEEALPNLMMRQKLSQKRGVEMFEGQKAIFSLFADLIADARPKELYLAFSLDEENKTEQANLFFRNLAVRRKEKGLDVRLLKNSRHYVKEKHTKLKLRYTSYNLPQGITIFRDYVILLSWQDTPMAVKIESEIFARQQRKFFLELWEQAK